MKITRYVVSNVVHFERILTARSTRSLLIWLVDANFNPTTFTAALCSRFFLKQIIENVNIDTQNLDTDKNWKKLKYVKDWLTRLRKFHVITTV